MNRALIRKKMKPASVDSWSVAIAAVSGGVLGMVVARAYHVLHDHSRLPFEDLLPHFIPQLITGGVGGALVMSWAAAIHERKRRAGRSAPSPGSRSEHPT